MNLFQKLFGPKNVNVEKIKEESIDMEMQAAGNLTEATGALGKLLQQTKLPSKILVVNDEDVYNDKVVNYAYKLAQRLDCEITVLDTVEISNKFGTDRKQRELTKFTEASNKNYMAFKAKAIASGIKISHLTKVGNLDSIVAAIKEEDIGIRYVLSSPINKEENVRVYDLKCSKISTRPRLYK